MWFPYFNYKISLYYVSWKSSCKHFKHSCTCISLLFKNFLDTLHEQLFYTLS